MKNYETKKKKKGNESYVFVKLLIINKKERKNTHLINDYDCCAVIIRERQLTVVSMYVIIMTYNAA